MSGIRLITLNGLILLFSNIFGNTSSKNSVSFETVEKITATFVLKGRLDIFNAWSTA